MASSCHASVDPKRSIEEEVRRLKMCKDLLLNDRVFNKEIFSSLLELEKVGFCFFYRIIKLKKTGLTFRSY